MDCVGAFLDRREVDGPYLRARGVAFKLRVCAIVCCKVDVRCILRIIFPSIQVILFFSVESDLKCIRGRQKHCHCDQHDICCSREGSPRTGRPRVGRVLQD